MKSKHSLPNTSGILKIRFPFKGGFYAFQPDQIIRLEAESNYTYIHIRDHKPILMAKVLCAYEAILEPLGFVRTHKSHLINTLHVESVSTDGKVILNDHSAVDISRRKRRQIITILNHHGDAA
jgi:two-component system LytT family response regulator